MAAVRVFVDDAVQGDLPSICVKDGVPTTDRLIVREPIGDGGRLGALVLLVFAGPIGWIALWIISSSRAGRAEMLAVELPMSTSAYKRRVDARHRQSAAAFASVIGIAFAIFAVVGEADPGPLRVFAMVVTVGLAVAALVTWFRASVAVNASAVLVDLDASRRWVTLSQVHPAFVAACEAREQHQRV